MGNVKIGIGFGQWKFGLPTPDLICACARQAEEAGFDSIWLSDHIVTVNPTLDIGCLFAMIAGRTARLKMGPSVFTLPARHPVQVAKTYATLDYISNGRMVMAVGSGNDVRDLVSCGVPAKARGRRLEEGIHILRKLWTESNVTHVGEFYSFENVTIEPKPRNGPLDIWIGGKSDAILKRVARLGDGWFPALTSPTAFREDMEKLKSYGEECGRTIDTDEAGVLLFTHVCEDRAGAVKAVEPFFHGFSVAPEKIMNASLIGSGGECVEQINRFVEAGCSKFVLRPICAPKDIPDQLARFGDDILPAFL